MLLRRSTSPPGAALWRARRTALAVVAALAAVALGACLGEKDPTGIVTGAACSPRGPYMGEFEGSVAGATADSLAGCAYFVVQQVPACEEAEPSRSFQIILSNGRLGRFEHTIALARCGSRPPAGTYSVGTDVGLVRGRVLENGSSRIFDFSAGTIELTSSTFGTVRGTISITATEVGGTATITLFGEFIARCFDPDTPRQSDEGNPDDSYFGPCHPRFAA